MQLGTFGAILQFGLTLEERAAEFYEAGPPASLFAELGQAARKRVKRLEQARRESISEMILESISGLDGDQYEVALDAAAGEAEQQPQARAMEQAAAGFYRDAAAKMPIREVSRLFTRLAGEHEQAAARLG